MAGLEPPTAPDTAATRLPEEIRQRLEHMERRTTAETALAALSAAALGGMLLWAVFGRGELLSSLRLLGVALFAALALLPALAWLALERSRRTRLAEVRTLAEEIYRHVSSELALRDPMTGTFHRAALGELALRYFQRALRTDRPLALAVFSLESFAELNRSFGYAAANQALAEFGHLLMSSTRGTDLVCRWEGDQFVVLLADTSRLGAELVMLRVKDRLAATRIRLYEEEVPLRFVWGAAVFQKGMDLEALLREGELDLLRQRSAREAAAKTTGGSAS